MSKPFWVYVLHCADGSYCTGRTDDLELRMAKQSSAGGLHGNASASRSGVWTRVRNARRGTSAVGAAVGYRSGLYPSPVRDRSRRPGRAEKALARPRPTRFLTACACAKAQTIAKLRFHGVPPDASISGSGA